MPWCPKCKKKRQVLVTLRTSGDLDEKDDIDAYPCIQGDVAEPSDPAYCFECEYEGPLSEFKMPEEGE